MFDNFRVAVYRIVIESGSQGLYLPAYKGSTLRGGFGHVFRRICCSQPAGDCKTCLLAQACPYARIFEPAPPPDSAVLKNYSDIPRPFVMEPPLDNKTYYAPGEQLVFRLVLVGQAIQYLPYFILVFKELGSIGIGKGRLPYILADIQAVNILSGNRISVYNRETNLITAVKNDCTLAEIMANQPQHPRDNRLAIEFLTMTRLKYEHSLVSAIPFHVLIRNLLRRISTLYYFYHEQKAEAIDYKALVAKAETVAAVSSDLRLVPWERYSHRKDTRMNMDGMIGEVVYEGDVGEFMPLLRLGEMIHVGKGCVFGLGKYKIKKSPPGEV